MAPKPVGKVKLIPAEGGREKSPSKAAKKATAKPAKGKGSDDSGTEQGDLF